MPLVVWLSRLSVGVFSCLPVHIPTCRLVVEWDGGIADVHSSRPDGTYHGRSAGPIGNIGVENKLLAPTCPVPGTGHVPGRQNISHPASGAPQIQGGRGKLLRVVDNPLPPHARTHYQRLPTPPPPPGGPGGTRKWIGEHFKRLLVPGL